MSYTRQFTPRVFCGEDIPVHLELVNNGLLPIMWLHLQESVPPELTPGSSLDQVIRLGPRGSTSLKYVMKARKRGYYHVGPLFTYTGDLFGFGGESRSEGDRNSLTVYPRVVNFTNLKLPSYTPMGTLRHHQPIYEDPSRVIGKRDYVSGDSLKRVDWKATASSGKLQVKYYEPSMSLAVAIFLNLDQEDYGKPARLDALELAIVITASLANWINNHKQSVGLFTNGSDPLVDLQPFKPLLPHRGRNHLMRIFDILARVQYAHDYTSVDLLEYSFTKLTWGTTLILITGQGSETVFNDLLRLRRAGFSPVLILVGHSTNVRDAIARGKQFRIPIFFFQNEFDLDIWR